MLSLFVFLEFEVFGTLLTKCTGTRWFDLSSFDSVNTLVPIGNERALSLDRINNTHTNRFQKTTRVLVSLSIMRFKRKKFKSDTPNP